MTRLSRQQLYVWVWSKPTSQIAEELGISDSALGKTCKKFNVPKPPRGYWTKVEKNLPVVRTPLQDPSSYSMKIAVEVSEQQFEALCRCISAGERSPEQLLEQQPAMLVARGQAATERSPSIEARREDPIPSTLGGSAKPWSDSLAVKLTQSSAPPSSILSLSSQLELVEAVQRLLIRLRSESSKLTPGELAILTLWISEAEEAVAQVNPIALILRECELIASGKLHPPWWEACKAKASTTRS